jgi:dTDP-4-amino-4,6-dideoxygalactose transaminase
VKVPFLDLEAQYSALGKELESAVTEVLRSGYYALGPEVERFETEFAAFCGTEYAIGVNSGTSALHLALLAEGIGPGDEVITVSMSFVATAAAILYTGATPVYVDIEPGCWTMAPDAIERAITPRTKAIMPVHLHGRMADMPRILAVAEAHGIPVIEDAAQAHGAVQNGATAGSLGVSGCFSFYPGKNLGACGEAGAITTNDAARADKMRMLRDWGQAAKYHHVLPGFNYRMDAVQAAALRVKLRYVEAWSRARVAHAGAYGALLDGVAIGLPAPHTREQGTCDHVYHVYAVRSRNRDALRDALAKRNIATNMHYPIPIHLQPAYASDAFGPGDFPQTELLAVETLSLPMFPELTEAQLAAVAAVLAAAAGEAS